MMQLLVVIKCVTTTEYAVIVVQKSWYREDSLQAVLFIAAVVEEGEEGGENVD